MFAFPPDGSRACSLPMPSFDELEEDFLRIVRETVCCTVTTVEGGGRPRDRMRTRSSWCARAGRSAGP